MKSVLITLLLILFSAHVAIAANYMRGSDITAGKLTGYELQSSCEKGLAEGDSCLLVDGKDPLAHDVGTETVQVPILDLQGNQIGTEEKIVPVLVPNAAKQAAKDAITAAEASRLGKLNGLRGQQKACVSTLQGAATAAQVRICALVNTKLQAQAELTNDDL